MCTCQQWFMDLRHRLLAAILCLEVFSSVFWNNFPRQKTLKQWGVMVEQFPNEMNLFG